MDRVPEHVDTHGMEGNNGISNPFYEVQSDKLLLSDHYCERIMAAATAKEIHIDFTAPYRNSYSSPLPAASRIHGEIIAKDTIRYVESDRARLDLSTTNNFISSR